MSAPRWPVTLLTGMLGSGKTTLLRTLLSDPAMRGTAVLINEIGEIGIDHQLVERIDGETVLLRSGCLCCSLRADLPQTLGKLRRRWLGDDTLDLRRVVVETTGLARPMPILRELVANPLTTSDFPLAGVITTVDALHSAAQLQARPEAREQVAVADVLLLTKTDIADPDAARQARRAAAALNPLAPVHLAVAGRPDAAADLLGLMDGRATARAWQPAVSPYREAPDPHGHEHGRDPCHGSVGGLALRTETPLAWTTLMAFMETLLVDGAPGLLRLKGIFNVTGSDRPVVIQAVGNMLHSAEALDAWPDGDRSSRFVLILDEPNRHRRRIADLAATNGHVWTISG